MSSSESRKGRSYIPWLVGGALTFAVLLVVGLLALSLFTHDAKSVVDKCKPSPDLAAAAPDAEGLVELQGNRARPTLTIALADRTAKLEDIFFSTKDRKTVEGAVTAQLIEVPRRGADRAERIVGDVRVHASPRIGRTMVFLEACVDREGRWRAGSYQGTVRIYGPQLNDFDYAIVITQKWPWEVAVLLLLVAGIAFFAVAFFTESLSFEGRKGHQGRRVLGRTLFGALVAIGAMAPTFWGTYWNNPTWGSEPDAHIAGIVAAGFTAAIAGLALAKRLLAAPHDGSEDKDQDKAGARPGPTRTPSPAKGTSPPTPEAPREPDAPLR